MLTHWHALSRDSRDTLFLLAVVAWVVLPQVGNLPIWTVLIAGVALGWRGWLAWTARPLPSRAWRLGLVALAVVGTLWTHKTILGRDAGVTLVVVLLALKTLELRARRDAFVVFFLSFFTMLTNFFFSQSLLTAAAMLIAMLGLLTALINAHMPVGRPALRESAGLALRMTALGAPIMAALFLFFPRMAPLWGLPADAMSGRSGLSSTMEIGNLASLALDDGIALRVRFETPDNTPPPQQDLYFRGPVFSVFDGREWKPMNAGGPFDMPLGRQTAADLRVRGEGLRYEVTLEPNNRPWLLLLDAAETRPQGPGLESFMTPELAWVASRPVTDLLRYQATSHTDFRHGPVRRVPALEAYTQLPPSFNPRTLQFAMDLRRRPELAQADAQTLSDAVLQHLARGGYTYTLEPGVYGQHTADEFWFDRKEGFCEHIASAFVILMRALDVPARIVTGYQGGERNAVDGYWVVRQSDAHAWAEIWQSGVGWVRVDPTGAVASGRIGQLQRLTQPRNAFATALVNVSPGLAQSLRASWDALNNRWNQWVLSYTQSKQLNLLKGLGFDTPSWEDLALVLGGLAAFAALLGAGWGLWERQQHDPWLRLLHDARHRLARLGLPLPPHLPPRGMAEAALTHFGAAAQPLHQWLLALEGLRYAPPGTRDAQLPALRRQWRQLSWPSRP